MRPVCLNANSIQIPMLEAMLCRPQNRKLGSGKGSRCACTSWLELSQKHMVPVACAMGKGLLTIPLVKWTLIKLESRKRYCGTKLRMEKHPCNDAKFQLFFGLWFCSAWVRLVVVWPWAHFGDFSTWRFFFQKIFRPFLWGSPMSILHLSWGGGILFCAF